MSRLRDERGVAMVTVLLVGAVMTVVIASAALIGLQEYRASRLDRSGGRALAYAEAGVDRTILWMRSGAATWKDIVLSGCTVAGVNYQEIRLHGSVPALAGSNDVGTYSAAIRRLSACPAAMPSPRVPQQVMITSSGCVDGTVGVTCPSPNSERVVRQGVALSSKSLPIGSSAARVDVRGNPTFQNTVLFATAIVSTRQQMSVTGTDFYYKKSDFYPCTGSTTPGAGPVYRCYNSTNDGPMPASVHSSDRIFLKPNGTNEHPPSPNCTQAQFIWDGSITGGPIPTLPGGCPAGTGTVPPTAQFTVADYARIAQLPRLSEEDHRYFKQIAQSSGLYCGNYRPAVANTCKRAGVDATVTGDIDSAEVAGLGNFFVAYVEFPTTASPLTNSLGWNVSNPAPTNPCSSTAAANTMVVLIVRNGGVETKTHFMGAIFAEDGNFDSSGNLRFEGTLAASTIRTRGAPVICMSQRWLDAMPGVFMNVLPLDWSEVDR